MDCLDHGYIGENRPSKRDLELRPGRPLRGSLELVIAASVADMLTETQGFLNGRFASRLKDQIARPALDESYPPQGDDASPSLLPCG